MTRHARARFLGLPLDLLSMRRTVDRIEEILDSGQPGAHLDLNAANVVLAHASPDYARDLEAADLVSPDGQSVVWAARAFGSRVEERVTGIDLMGELLERAPERGWRVYLVGARRQVVEEVARRLRAQGVNVVGYRDGYFSPNKDAFVAAQARDSGADLLFVGMPSPRKERFIIGAARPAGVPFSMGVGGSFDVIAGRVRRAPRWAQRMGLEWAYRLAQEPRRLVGRYTVSNARFIGLVGSELLHRIRGRPARPTPATPRPTRLALVCSSGGHLLQLTVLRDWWAEHDRFWVTFDTADATSALADERTYWCYHPTNRNAWNLVRNTVLAWRVLVRERPTHIVSTGAAVAVPFFYLGRLLGARLIYLEVFDRIEGPTLTGQIVRPITQDFLVQWPEQERFYRGAVVVGPVL